MKRKWLTRKFAAWKFATGRFRGLGAEVAIVYATHYHTLEGASAKYRTLEGTNAKYRTLEGTNAKYRTLEGSR